MPKSPHPHQRRKTGFTLIELLIVIAIIGILAAILFPVFARVRENARRSSCASNLKQIALDMTQYRQDYDSRFPFGPNTAPNTAVSSFATAWAPAIMPYIKSHALFQCPSDAHKFPTTSDPTQDGYTDYWYNAALSMNWDGGAATPNYRVAGINEAELLRPSLTILVGEGDGNGFSTGSTRVNGCTVADQMNTAGPEVTLTTTPPKCDTVTYRAKAIGINKGQSNHLSGLNLAYTDGHVKWQRTYEEADNQDGASSFIFNVRAGFNTSGNSPTFNAVSEVNR